MAGRLRQVRDEAKIHINLGPAYVGYLHERSSGDGFSVFLSCETDNNGVIQCYHEFVGRCPDRKTALDMILSAWKDRNKGVES